MPDENTLHAPGPAPSDVPPVPVVVWGSGNMGRAAIRTVEEVRCQEIFDYNSYDQPDAVRSLVGMGEPMSYQPPMVASGVPTMVWGGQARLLARGLGVELDEVRETLERRALDVDVHNAMGVVTKPSDLRR